MLAGRMSEPPLISGGQRSSYCNCRVSSARSPVNTIKGCANGRDARVHASCPCSGAGSAGAQCSGILRNRVGSYGPCLCGESVLCLSSARPELQLPSNDVPHHPLHILLPRQHLCRSQDQHLRHTS